MRHLYIHVPFCQRRCSYCDFSIAVRKRLPVREYVDAVLAEARAVPLDGLDTIYFGGGTPSLLPPEVIAELLGGRRAPEVSLEANPEDVTADSARAWSAA